MSNIENRDYFMIRFFQKFLPVYSKHKLLPLETEKKEFYSLCSRKKTTQISF